MWGRGATDMKASDAALLYLAATLTEPKVDLTYVFYDHEEVVAEKNGLRKVVQAHPEWIQGDFAIIGEPTNCGIEGGCNGTMRFDVVSHGVAAHSARAWMGENAIHKAGEALARLNAYEPQSITVDGLEYREGLNATLISGGNGTNVIPDECRIHVNYRFAPDKDIRQAKALMMGADAGAELNNGEHAATGGVFEGFGIADEGRIAVRPPRPGRSTGPVAGRPGPGTYRPRTGGQARLDRCGPFRRARHPRRQPGRRRPAARAQARRAGAGKRPDADGRHPARLARLIASGASDWGRRA